MRGMHVFLFSTEKKKDMQPKFQQNAVYLQLFLPYSLLKETNFFLFFFFSSLRYQARNTELEKAGRPSPRSMG